MWVNVRAISKRCFYLWIAPAGTQRGFAPVEGGTAPSEHGMCHFSQERSFPPQLLCCQMPVPAPEGGEGEGGTVRHQCQPEQGRLPRSRELLLAHDGESCMIIS